ncbi:hypothetical protein Hdeb2414_s0008g00282461 [Helianthus debilis subsp. tardiflorus]
MQQAEGNRRLNTNIFIRVRKPSCIRNILIDARRYFAFAWQSLSMQPWWISSHC